MKEKENNSAAVDRQVKIDCLRLTVPFIYTGNSIYQCGSDEVRSGSVMGPRRFRGRQVSGIAGGSKISPRG